MKNLKRNKENKWKSEEIKENQFKKGQGKWQKNDRSNDRKKHKKYSTNDRKMTKKWQNNYFQDSQPVADQVLPNITEIAER